ncbi:MAG: hypothetical protein ACLFU8_06175 [Anaerolineales bacterium]
MKVTDVVASIKPFVLGWISETGGGAGPYAPTPHDLNSAHHSGDLADAQFPNALLRDGSRSLLGNLSVAAGATLDGVDLSVFKSDYDTHVGADDAHHDPVTIGSDGLSGKLSLSLQELTLAAIDHADLSNIDTNQHVDHSAVSVGAGTGLTGGGTIAGNVTLNHGTGDFGDLHTNYTEHDAAETITGSWAFQADLSTYHVRAASSDEYDLGSSTLLWRKIYASEFETVLFALNTLTISGARQVWGHDAGALGAAVASGATTIDFGKAMVNGDFVELRGYGRVEYVQVGSLSSGTTYNVTRNLDGSGANDWPAGAPFLVLGASGDPRVEIDAAGPYLRILLQGAAYNANTEYGRFGDMNGAFGVSGHYPGLGVGDYAGGNYLKYDSNGGLVMKAASGGLVIDSGGLDLVAGAGTTGPHRIVWSSGSAVQYGGIVCDSSGVMLVQGVSEVHLQDAIGRVELENGVLKTISGLGGASGDFYAGADVRIGGGLYVGSASVNPDTDDIHYEGDLRPVRGGTTYTSYTFVPLTTPLTHTSFDGDAFSDVGTATKIENTSWSSAIPANAVALLIDISCVDSGSWGTNGLYFRVGPSSSYPYAFIVRPKGGNVYEAGMSVVPCTNGDLWYQVNASGTNTLTVFMKCWGYWI